MPVGSEATNGPRFAAPSSGSGRAFTRDIATRIGQRRQRRHSEDKSAVLQGLARAPSSGLTERPAMNSGGISQSPGWVHFEPALLSLVDRAARRLHLPDLSLNAGELMKAAEQRAGRSFRSREIETALAAVIDACEREADLSLFGRFSFRWDALHRLQTVLGFEAAEAERPEIAGAEIAAPIFVTGLPRSGTTFLHMLLALDPTNRAPLSWEVMRPYRDPHDRGRDRRVQQTEREFRAFRRLAPGLEKLHPLAAATPQECTEITSSSFQSLRFDTIYRVPSYLRWLESRGHDQAFRFHKRFLQHLQIQDPAGARRRWVLKCPDHVFTLKSIFQVYPDARFVFMHRDPTSVLPSAAKLTEVLRAPFTRTLDRVALGAEVAHRCAQGADRILAASELVPENRVFHLHYNELTSDPIGALERLNGYFQVGFGDEARGRVRSFLERRPRGGYGINHYDPREFGLEPARIRRQFASYLAAFGRLASRAAEA
jgi:hypothetical protein